MICVNHLLSRGSCDASLKWPASCLSLWPPPPPAPAEPPTGRKDPLPKLECLLLGLLSRWREREQRGGVTDLENIVNSPHLPLHSPFPFSYPVSLIPLPPHIDRRSSCSMCVCVCACIRTLHMGFSGCMCTKKECVFTSVQVVSVCAWLHGDWHKTSRGKNNLNLKKTQWKLVNTLKRKSTLQ